MLIYTNESRVVDAIGSIDENMAIGSFYWDGSQYAIQLSHIVSSGNPYSVRIKMFTNLGGAKNVFDAISIGPLYTLTALPKQYPYYTDRLGIGTGSPGSPLDVQCNSSALGINIRQRTGNDFANLVFSNTTNTGLGSVGYVGTSRLRFTTNGLGDANEKLSILANGNVGIGTTSPQTILQLGEGSLSNGTANQYLRVNAGGYNGLSYAHLDLFNFGNNFGNALGWRLTSATEGVGVSVGRSLSFNTVVTDGSGNPSSATERMRIASNGNVGIGTTNTSSYPFGEKLNVAGNISTNGTKIGFGTLDAFTAYGTSAAHYGMSYGSGANPIAVSGFFGVGFFTNGAERMRVENNGNVGIGTTSPGAKLDVSGDFNVTDSTSYLQVDSTGVNAEGYNVTGQNSGLELQDSVAKIGLDLSNSFVGLNVQTGLGAWLENENVYKFGIAPTLGELTSAGLVQTADTPSNDSRVEGWIKIYDESSGQMFFMPVYL